MGRIGSRVAQLLHPFETRLIAFDPYLSPEKAKPLEVELTDLETLLKESDVVTLHAVETAETKGFIGEAQLKTMKATAYLVNTARGGLINETALAKGLKEGWIAGAALDVWWPAHWWDPAWNPNGAPVPSKYPIWRLPNVIATPHNIGSTDTPSDASLCIIAENIRRVAAGRPLINQVDKNLQY